MTSQAGWLVKHNHGLVNCGLLVRIQLSTSTEPSISFYFIFCQYLDSSNADHRFRYFLNGCWEEESDRQSHWTVQGHCDEHPACRDNIAKQDVGHERHEHCYFAGHKERCQVHSPKVGTLKNHGNLLPEMLRKAEICSNSISDFLKMSKQQYPVGKTFQSHMFWIECHTSI